MSSDMLLHHLSMQLNRNKRGNRELCWKKNKTKKPKEKPNKTTNKQTHIRGDTTQTPIPALLVVSLFSSHKGKSQTGDRRSDSISFVPWKGAKKMRHFNRAGLWEDLKRPQRTALLHHLHWSVMDFSDFKEQAQV